MDIKKLAKSIRALAAQMDPEAAERDAREQDPTLRTNLNDSKKEVLITSIENDSLGSHGGRVFQVFPMNAARCITEGTHRLSTPEEVSAYRKELDERRISILAEAEKAKGPVPKIEISSELIAAAVAAQSKPAGRTRAEQNQT